jgi:hypothetical protein
MLSAKEFEAALIDRLRTATPPHHLTDEGDLEKRCVLPIMLDLVKRSPGPHVYAHPWNQLETCEPNCAEGRGLVEQAELHGCPACWSDSKDWAKVRLYGEHNFDIVVGDRNDSFAVELKLLRQAPSGNRRANDGFQRFLGQCALARLIHPRVIGFCVAEKRALDFDLTATEHLARKRFRGADREI